MTRETSCQRCPRLASYLDGLSLQYPDYHCAPVAGWGLAPSRLLIVGLAPGLHGANRTGRPFTGDSSGHLLFQLLREFDWVHGTQEDPDLQGVRIVNAVRCLPPGNRPVAAEIKTCNRFLSQELQAAGKTAVILSLGTIAHRAVLMAMGLPATAFKFGHGRVYELAARAKMIDSYHCSRYNTQTGRLTVQMFRNIFKKVSELIE